MGAAKELEVRVFPRPVSIGTRAFGSKLVTVEKLAELLECTPNAIRMKEKRGILRRVPTKERKVLFDLQESLKALGYESAMTW